MMPISDYQDANENFQDEDIIKWRFRANTNLVKKKEARDFYRQ